MTRLEKVLIAVAVVSVATLVASAMYAVAVFRDIAR